MDKNFRYIYDDIYDKDHKQGLHEEKDGRGTILQAMIIARLMAIQKEDELREIGLRHVCPHCNIVMVKRGIHYECDFCGHSEIDKELRESPLADLDDDIKSRLNKFVKI